MYERQVILPQMVKREVSGGEDNEEGMVIEMQKGLYVKGATFVRRDVSDAD